MALANSAGLAWLTMLTITPYQLAGQHLRAEYAAANAANAANAAGADRRLSAPFRDVSHDHWVKAGLPMLT
ncbi:hypothetical protein [Pseudomonas frederiksbergensis]|uniref:hypothetical protein n=1 Tax=Pseudomonas frederiksbergensis TaxID=104087 RepID=UPI00101AE61E|nr:hypothetical protein [Pseudomonas frederiksbergensis]